MKYLRVFVYLGLCCFCGYQLYQTLYDFINGDKWTNSITQVETDQLEMPEIIVCNYNRIDKYKAMHLGITDEVLGEYVKSAGMESVFDELRSKISIMSLDDHFYAALFGSYMSSYGNPSGMLAPFSPHMSNMTLGRYKLIARRILPLFYSEHNRALYTQFMKNHQEFNNVADLLKMLAISCRDSAILCRFETSMIDCCNSSRHVLTQYGVCFTIRSPPNANGRSVQRSGGINGLQVYLNANLDRHISAPVNNWLEQGFKLYISYNPDRPNFKDFAVPVGFHTFLEMHRTKETTTESSGCHLFEKACTDETVTSLNHSYSSDSCFYGCGMLPVITACNCLPIEFYPGGHIPICEPDDIFSCAMPKVKHIWEMPNVSMTDKTAIFEETFACLKACKSPCEQDNIDIVTGTVKTPADSTANKSLQIMEMIGLRITENGYQNGMATLDIYFSRLVYTVIDTYPKTSIEQLIGNVGGILGIYIGASCLSFFDVFDSIVKSKREKVHAKNEVNHKMVKTIDHDDIEVHGRPLSRSTLYDGRI